MDKLLISLYNLVALILIIYIFKSYNQHNRLGFLMHQMLIFALIIVLGYNLNFISNSYIIMSIGNSLVFASINFMLLFILKYLIELTGIKLNSTFLKICFIYAFIESIILITNPLHEFVLTYTFVEFNDNKILSYVPKLPFYIHILFSYFLITLSTILLVKKKLTVPKEYKVKYNIILYSILIAVFINFIFLFKKDFNLDLSIISYGIIVCIIYNFTFKYKPLHFLYRMQKLILMNIENPIILFDYDDKIAEYNKAFTEIFNLSESEKSTITLKDFLDKYKIKIKDLSRSQEIDYVIEKENKKIYLQCTYQYINDKNKIKTGVLITFNNVSELKLANNKLEVLATHDQLTGLYNKYVFDSKVDKWNNEKSLPISIGVLNINNLKAINNFFGTKNGDLVIKCLAEVIKKHTNDKWFSARLYGEDFVIVMPNTNEKDSINIIENIKQEFNSIKKFDFDINVEFGAATKSNIDNSIIDYVSLAKEIMNNKKILNESSLKNALLESLKQSLIDSDLETEQHVERTSELALKLGENLGLSYNDLSKLNLLAILHDIGKITIPNYILTKPDKLNEKQWEIMKHHTISGYRIAKSYPELNEISHLILCHHERWDGTGYPNGLKGKDIPLLSRIISIVDSYDVMTHDRPYHTAISKDEAIKELERCSGTQFCPEITKAFISMMYQE